MSFVISGIFDSFDAVFDKMSKPTRLNGASSQNNNKLTNLSREGGALSFFFFIKK